ncbi:hypothetical protein KDX38_28880 [Pseudomonas sp. CDFA 602]|uniref:alpha/beta hydrolase n=1 Tax=Pseudomonas californiensis TaxID=2829823 RepID=UPI001E51CA87|nr:alpha/beta hydrolase [Pseudomonas californiensis]MCD5997548.1 hypothetical protein [Pseudomonas californiensis]MCD6003155.1 hypothetical protein [Pseudomonas californiensis]
MRMLISLTLGLILYAGQTFADTEVREEQIYLPIQVGDHLDKIEALIVRPIKGEKFPIALIINGSSLADPSAARADWLAKMAHDYAHRGWLAASIIWPGYGHSSGRFRDDGGNCTAPRVADFLNEHGAELGAALVAIRQRSDVDPSLALGVGVSIGGASMLNLGAQSGHPLAAIINISGGVYHSTHWADAPNCSLFQSDLIQTVSKFGAENPTPTLWIYAQNDPHFGPDLVNQMIAGYRSQGGNADLVMLPPFGTDGHTLYRNDASALINPNIDDFLRRNRLPSMNRGAFMPFLSRLTPAERLVGETYLLSVTEKAMAMSKDSSKIYRHYGDRTLEGAREEALSLCRKDNGDSCRIVAENQDLISGWEDIVLGLAPTKPDTNSPLN